MPVRKIKFAPEERYHICARGVGKQQIFLEDRDYIRFLFLLLYFQGPDSFFNITRQITYFVKHQVFNISDEEKQKLLKQRAVSVESFALMPNHFHIALQEKLEKGISGYMQRILNSYAKYFNVKYKRVGHVFEGPFRAVHVKRNEQMLYLSAYMHRNPREISTWTGKELLYPWSSYQDYVKDNRWKDLLLPDIVMDQFSTTSKYQKFVEQSGAKEKAALEKASLEHFLFD